MIAYRKRGRMGKKMTFIEIGFHQLSSCMTLYNMWIQSKMIGKPSYFAWKNCKISEDMAYSTCNCGKVTLWWWNLLDKSHLNLETMRLLFLLPDLILDTNPETFGKHLFQIPHIQHFLENSTNKSTQKSRTHWQTLHGLLNVRTLVKGNHGCRVRLVWVPVFPELIHWSGPGMS